MLKFRWQCVSILFYFALAIVFFAPSASSAEVVIDNKEKVYFLDPGDIIDFQPPLLHRGFFDNNLRIYCYRGNRKTLARLFESVELHFDVTDDDYTQYEGDTPSEVRVHYGQKRSLFSFSLFAQKRTRLQLSPFTQQCIGIEASQAYRVRLQQVRVDFWRVILLTVGILLFTYAAKLSHNALFYYITGVLLGICSSFMLLIWLTSKLVPRRTVMYSMLIGGWTIGIYVIQMLLENLQLIVVTYRAYVFWYILVTGLVSFFFCYRLGPPDNQRSKNIVKWLLQLIALIFIYFTSHFEEASAALVIVAVMMQYFPRRVWHKMRTWYLTRFPKKRRLLTNEQYYEEGVRETTKALNELRTYASSPDCKQWRVMSKLSDPMRFAAFVEGASHLRDEEILQFESARYNEDVIDDDDSDLSEEEDDSQQQQQQQERQSRSPRPRTGRSPYRLHRSPHSMHLPRQITPTLSHAEINEDDGRPGSSVVYGNSDVIESSLPNTVTTPRRINRMTPNENSTPQLRTSALVPQPMATTKQRSRSQQSLLRGVKIRVRRGEGDA